jgi:hypothetical protein
LDKVAESNLSNLSILSRIGWATAKRERLVFVEAIDEMGL